jgi:succinate dehydrogenase / fumarate reductase, cytochrome b subunit
MRSDSTRKQRGKKTLGLHYSGFCFITLCIDSRFRRKILKNRSSASPVEKVGLAIGSILLAWWLVAVAAGGEVVAATHAFIASPIGVTLLFGWSVAFFYHLCSGIRHLAWDAGYGFDISTTYRSGYAVLAATIVRTVLAWLYVWLAA